MSDLDRLSAAPAERPLPAAVERPRFGGLASVLGRSLASVRRTTVVPGAAGALEPQGVGTRHRPRTRISPWWASLVGLVVLPSLAASLYLFVFAADQFVSEARFAVRQADIGMGTMGDAVQGAAAAAAAGSSLLSVNSASQDAHVVASYLRSRAVVDDLLRELDLRSLFRRPEADAWARLPADAPMEDLVRYWTGMTFTYVDAPSGIVTLEVRAFRPEDARRVAETALRLAERLVDAMSDRARADALAFAEKDMARAATEWREAIEGLRSFRDREGLIDPVRAADDVAKLIQGLVVEKIRLETELAVAAAGLAPDAPGLAPQRARLASIDRQIAELRARLSGEGSGARNAAATLARFEAVEMRRHVAERLYLVAQDGLNRARTLADRRRVYLTVFAPPGVAEEALYPRRWALSVLIPALLLTLWGIGALVVLSVEDHRL